MSGKIKPSKSFIEKFKKGFKIGDTMEVIERKNRHQETAG
jgi:hypothetical protein